MVDKPFVYNYGYLKCSFEYGWWRVVYDAFKVCLLVTKLLYLYQSLIAVKGMHQISLMFCFKLKTLGTLVGRNQSKSGRNQVEYVSYTGLKSETVPIQTYSIQEIVHKSIWWSCQVFMSCHRKGFRCNGACHSHKSCHFESIGKHT